MSNRDACWRLFTLRPGLPECLLSKLADIHGKQQPWCETESRPLRRVSHRACTLSQHYGLALVADFLKCPAEESGPTIA